MKKNILLLIITLILSVVSVNAAEFYTTYDLSFSDSSVDSVYVQGAECTTSSCTDVNSNEVRVYQGNVAEVCIEDAKQSGSSEEFQSCMQTAIVDDGVVSLLDNNKVILGYDIPSTFGFLTYFSAEDDQYLVKGNEMNNFDCEFDICFDNQVYSLDFVKKEDAIAEIGQLNIKNLDNQNLPVQVEVPVSIEQSVCSAFRYSNSDQWKPNMPEGYSDNSALTEISLVATQVSNSNILLDQSVVLPIEADKCASIAAFSWTPDASLLNEQVEFRVESEVIDNQVSSSLIDWAEVIETVYPENLDNTCWTRAHDFTLSNIESTEMTTSVAQITQGESLFAVFEGGAYRDESMTPMQYEARIFFDDTLVYQELLSSSQDLTQHSFDLTNEISGLPVGEYEVKLETVPVSSSCETTSTVVQTQNLNLLAPDTFEVTFNVQDAEGNYVDDANINLELTQSLDNYVNEPIYNQTGVSTGDGVYIFSNVIRGEYDYEVNKDGFVGVKNSITVGSDMDVYVTLPSDNVAPMIQLPEEFTFYYQETHTFDIREYISDFNDDINELEITPEVVSGDMDVSFNYPDVTVSTNSVNTAVLGVNVEDTSGAQAYDEMNINFIDNEIPEITLFEAEPSSGEQPFNTNFRVEVSDVDMDNLNCTIEFGDGNSQTDTCENLNGIAHTYNNVGTYNAVLRVNDGFNDEIYTYEEVYVFERTVVSPRIDDFQITTSTGDFMIPTDVTLSWEVVHPNNSAMDCRLRINGENVNIPCDGDYTINDFNQSGISSFHLLAEADGVQVLRTLTREFYDDTNLLTPVQVEMDVDSRIAPGEFEFSIGIENESITSRTVQFKPSIVCDGVRNMIEDNNGIISSQAESSVNSDIKEFKFKVNTRDYKNNVLTNTNCDFEVEVIDMFNTPFTLSEGVIFAYPQEDELTSSISGRAADVTNFLESLVLNPGLNVGYNPINLKVINNEETRKEFSVSIISADLSLSVSEKFAISPSGTQDVQFGLRIREGTEPGMYPVRIIVNQNDDRQVKYGYILVN